MSIQAYVNGNPPATKKALRDAILNAPNTVDLFDTSFINNRGHIPISEMNPSDVIVGPNCENNRKWYANIRNGKLV